MRKPKILFIQSIIFFVIGIVLLITSFFLNISEFDSNNFTQLQFICAFRIISICFITISIISFFSYIFYNLLNKKINKNAVQIVIIFSLIFSIIISIINIMTKYNVTEDYYNIINDENLICDNYEDYFPYYNKMTQFADIDEINYSYGNYQLFSNNYVHVQNGYTTEQESPLYDVEYFSSNNRLMLFQYTNEKNNRDNGKKCIDGSIEYIEYMDEDFFEIRIVSDKSFYSFYVYDFDIISNDIEELTKTAISQYKLMTQM